MDINGSNIEDEQSALPNTRVIIGRNGAELTPFEPGKSGNPKGRPKGRLNLKTIMKRLLDEETLVEINGKRFTMSRAEFMMLEKFRLATSSENEGVRLRAIMDIEDRMDGTPVQSDTKADQTDEKPIIWVIPNRNSRLKPRDLEDQQDQ